MLAPTPKLFITDVYWLKVMKRCQVKTENSCWTFGDVLFDGKLTCTIAYDIIDLA